MTNLVKHIKCVIYKMCVVIGLCDGRMLSDEASELVVTYMDSPEIIRK